MKNEVKDKVKYFLLLFLFTLLFTFPALHLRLNGGAVSVFSCFVAALPVVALALIPRHKECSVVLLVLLLFSSIIDAFLVKQFQTFLLYDHALAMFTTDMNETTDFFAEMVPALAVLVPMIVVFVVLTMFFYHSEKTSYRMRWITTIVLAIIALWPLDVSRPPYNTFYEMSRLVQERYYIYKGKHFEGYEAKREVMVEEDEVYVLVIGESMRAQNCSMYGYERETTPRMEHQENLVIYPNYYSAACTTMRSVPLLLTPCTADNQRDTYKYRALYHAFQEVGFDCYAISECSFNKMNYLFRDVAHLETTGADSITMQRIEECAKHAGKQCIMVKLLGSHAYYHNYTAAFDRYHPNINSEPKVESDSLLANAYDNTILYTDYLLCNLMDSLEQLGKVATLIYISDHGETHTNKVAWHGGICDKKEYHVPFVVWYSTSYAARFPERVEALREHQLQPVNSDNIFYTFKGLAGITVKDEDEHLDWDISSSAFATHPRRLYTTDEYSIKTLD